MPLIKCIPEYNKMINIPIFNIPFKAFKNFELLDLLFFSIGGEGGRGGGGCLCQTENWTFIGVCLKWKDTHTHKGWGNTFWRATYDIFYVLHYFDAALVFSFVGFLSVLLSNTASFERTYNAWKVPQRIL